MAGYALTILTATALLATPAAAQSLLDTAGGRYEMQPVDGGVARLDTVTGDVEFCRVAGDAIVCTDATLGGGSGASGDGDLAARLDDLEARVEQLEEVEIGRGQVLLNQLWILVCLHKLVMT